MKTDPKYNEYRHKNKMLNSMSDEFVYVRNNGHRAAILPLVPVMAGRTNADPDYFVDLRINGFTERYLTVVEYVVSGSGYITYNGITRKVSKGDVYILHPIFTGHYGADKNDPYVKKWCNIGGRVLPALMKAYKMDEQVNIFKDCPWAEQYIDKIHDMLPEYDEDKSEDDDLKITQILLELVDRLYREQGKKSEKIIDIDAIVRYIDGHVAVEKITVESLSEMFYVNKRTLTRMFEKQYGTAPKKFITVKKIECAKKLLAENYSVEDISDALQFSSAEYFRKVFVSVEGMSPKAYKNYKNQKKG